MPASTTFSYGSSVTLADGSLTIFKSGCRVKRWNTKADGSGTPYEYGVGTILPAGNITLYAEWETSPTLTLTGATNRLECIEKVRVYQSAAKYRDYTTYANIPVFAGEGVYLLSNTTNWQVRSRNSASSGGYALFDGTVYFDVPADATGDATIGIGTYNVSGYTSVVGVTGWAATDGALMLPSAGFYYERPSSGSSSVPFDSLRSYDRYGNLFAQTSWPGSSNTVANIYVIPGGKVVMYPRYVDTLINNTAVFYDSTSGYAGASFRGNACHFTWPSAYNYGEDYSRVVSGYCRNSSVYITGLIDGISFDQLEAGE